MFKSLFKAVAATPKAETAVDDGARFEVDLPLAADGSIRVPEQAWQVCLTEQEIVDRLAQLSPEIPWCHYYNFGTDLHSIAPSAPRYMSKATGLKMLGRDILESIPYITKKGRIEELRVLDLACGEGGHSLELAKAGAKSVLGIEGRRLYVERATFAAQAFGASNATFRQGDVRAVDPEKDGNFDVVLFLGILHHLGTEDFEPTLNSLRRLTNDTLVLFTHTAEYGADFRFPGRLSEETTIEGGFKGRLYREHAENATTEEKERKVRSSLDNTMSFWPRESALLEAVRKAGFNHISRQMSPNPFKYPTEDFRVIYVCRV